MRNVPCRNSHVTNSLLLLFASLLAYPSPHLSSFLSDRQASRHSHLSLPCDVWTDRWEDGQQGQRKGGFAAPPRHCYDIERPPTTVNAMQANRLLLDSASSHKWIALYFFLMLIFSFFFSPLRSLSLEFHLSFPPLAYNQHWHDVNDQFNNIYWALSPGENCNQEAHRSSVLFCSLLWMLE